MPINNKWRTLFLLAFAELLAMGVWFSASAVVPALTNDWKLDDTGRAALTISVQIGFVVGAFGSAVLNLANRIPTRFLFTSTALLAALATILIPALATGLAVALPLRFLTGMFLAGVYPVGMKIMATWTKEDRGLGIGLLVGALTIGSASPHLINAFGGVGDWKYASPTPPFNWKYVGEIWQQRDLALANLGYLGHMWELYAMWTWIPIFLLASFRLIGIEPWVASAAAFVVIGAGGLGSLLAGQLADRLGRTTVTIASLAMSGACALVVGVLFGGNPIALVIVCLIWGFAVVADSAQFSACISELCAREYTAPRSRFKRVSDFYSRLSQFGRFH